VSADVGDDVTTAGAPPAAAPPGTPRQMTALQRFPVEKVARWVLAVLGAFVLFGILLAAQGANPLDVYANMWASTFQRPRSLQQIVIVMSPLVLGALAVAVPARAGMTNVGGEGQLVIGGVAACGTFLALGGSLGGPVLDLLMIVAAAVAGALWAGVAALLRLLGGVNEAITTLLLNFVAIDVLLFLIYQPWRADPAGQPSTKELAAAAKLPVLTGTRIHVGIVLALVAVVAVWLVLNRTRWGYAVSVAGGNPEAARRAGLRVNALVLSALMIGGALAGVAGMVHFAGVEYKLRPGFGHNLGYTAFLACWLAGQRPFPIVLAAYVFAALSVAADSLQIDSGIPAASVNVLTALILMAVLGFTATRRKQA